jgi:hypothetical protein
MGETGTIICLILVLWRHLLELALFVRLFYYPDLTKPEVPATEVSQQARSNFALIFLPI